MEEDSLRMDVSKAGRTMSRKAVDKHEADQAGANEKPELVEQPAASEQTHRVDARFDVALEGAIGTEQQQGTDGLTAAEQQLIYRYFPASPSLEMRLYKPDMSTNKVDPGSVGSRVDIRG